MTLAKRSLRRHTDRVHLCLLRQLQISLLVAESFDPCIQAHAVAVRAAQIAAVLVGIRIEA